MSTAIELIDPHGVVVPITASTSGDAFRLRSALRTCEAAFDAPMTLIDASTGEVQYAARDALGCELGSRLGLLQDVVRLGRPVIIENEAPLALLALPLRQLGHGRYLVAVGTLLSQSVYEPEDVKKAAKRLGIDAERAWQWSRTREAWPVHLAQRLADATLDKLVAVQSLESAAQESSEAVAHAQEAYIELGLLHQLTNRLHLADDDASLWESAASWLVDAAPARTIAVVSKMGPDGRPLIEQLATTGGLLLRGECDVTVDQVVQLALLLGNRDAHRAVVCNRHETGLPTWPCPEVREMVCVPIAHGKLVQGWLLALNHRGAGGSGFAEFGSVESRLLSSVGTILGIHASNKRLFQRQSDLFCGAVRALSSAIDAKDRYTSGHSDRVARVSVCLAQRMGVCKHDIDAIYLGGLLHDIGKIGIDDHVLNKPDRLTEAEFAHIQQHPQFGYDILKVVEPLEDILPIVLHHHEAWNGSGYPHGLVGEATPLSARIVAVADAFDAMSSDRPYRKGMPDEKLDAILREGAGSQWDARVVEAFFEIRDQIRQVGSDENGLGAISIDPARWVN